MKSWKFAVPLALAVSLLSYDVGRVKKINDERAKNFTDELVLQEPPMSFADALMYKWDTFAYPDNAASYIEHLKLSALEEKIGRIGPGDEDRLDDLMHVVENIPHNVRADAIRAIARIGGEQTKHLLHSIIISERADHPQIYGLVEGEATDELYKLDPAMAVDAIITGKGWADDQIDMLIEFGDERSLRYLIQKDSSEEALRFYQKNKNEIGNLGSL